MQMKKGILLGMCLLLSVAVCPVSFAEELPSWNEGILKQGIINFVHESVDKSSPHYVAPEERIATFDNDGTLWVEKPVYTQVVYALDRVKELATKHPEWKTQKPFSVVLSGDPKAIATLGAEDLAKIVAVTETGMSVEEFSEQVKVWLAASVDHRFKQHYTALIYQPMLEVMQLLRDNGFTIYIVSGGGQAFIRTFSPETYHVDVSHVIGSAFKLKYTYVQGKPALIKQPQILLIDDKTGKPESIELFIGRKPVIAFGNSDGDREMLEWTQSGKGKRLMFLVHHDDAVREYAYGPESKVGTFSDSLMTEAEKNGWGVISMKNDWKTVFAFQTKADKNKLYIGA